MKVDSGALGPPTLEDKRALQREHLPHWMPLIDLRMPATFDRYHYAEDFARDRRALRDWCEQIRSR